MPPAHPFPILVLLPRVGRPSRRRRRRRRRRMQDAGCSQGPRPRPGEHRMQRLGAAGKGRSQLGWGASQVVRTLRGRMSVSVSVFRRMRRDSEPEFCECPSFVAHPRQRAVRAASLVPIMGSAGWRSAGGAGAAGWARLVWGSRGWRRSGGGFCGGSWRRVRLVPSCERRGNVGGAIPTCREAWVSRCRVECRKRP